MDPIPLETVRPLIFKTILMSDLRRVNFREKSEKKLTQQIEKELCYEVEEMIRYSTHSRLKDLPHVEPALGQLQGEEREEADPTD
jgi:hypothetical protein